MTTVAKIGFGCVTFGREIDETTSFKLLDYAVEHGISHFDTAAAYANGASEVILGKWLRAHPAESKDLTIATKILPPYTPEKIAELVSKSRERLGGNSIDLLYLHRWDETAETIESLQALDQLVASGSVKAIGVSNYELPQLRWALELQRENSLARFSVIQNNFNYAVSDFSTEYREFCANENIKTIGYSPLGAGFLTGKHKQGVEPGSRFDVIPGHQDVYFHKEAEVRLRKLEAISAESGHSEAHLALAWAMHQPKIDRVLVGGRTTNHIDQALAALDHDDFAIFGD
ncbi:MAG: aldo/keto reductase [Verrucomicrobiales bacterium]